MGGFWGRAWGASLCFLALAVCAASSAQVADGGKPTPPTQIQTARADGATDAPSRFGDYDSESALTARRRSLMDGARDIDRRAHPDAWAFSQVQLAQSYLPPHAPPTVENVRQAETLLADAFSADFPAPEVAFRVNAETFPTVVEVNAHFGDNRWLQTVAPRLNIASLPGGMADWQTHWAAYRRYAEARCALVVALLDLGGVWPRELDEAQVSFWAELANRTSDGEPEARMHYILAAALRYRDFLFASAATALPVADNAGAWSYLRRGEGALLEHKLFMAAAMRTNQQQAHFGVVGAIHDFETAVALFEQGSNRRGLVRARVGLANAHLDFVSAIEVVHVTDVNRYTTTDLASNAADVEQGYLIALQALRDADRGEMPAEWLQAKEAVGRALLARSYGRPIANLDAAIAHLEEAAALAPRGERAGAANDRIRVLLGQAYRQRGAQTGAGDQERAIATLRSVIADLPAPEDDVLWLVAQRELAGAYVDRVTGSTRENLASATRILRESAQRVGLARPTAVRTQAELEVLMRLAQAQVARTALPLHESSQRGEALAYRRQSDHEYRSAQADIAFQAAEIASAEMLAFLRGDTDQEPAPFAAEDMSSFEPMFENIQASTAIQEFRRRATLARYCDLFAQGCDTNLSDTMDYLDALAANGVSDTERISALGATGAVNATWVIQAYRHSFLDSTNAPADTRHRTAWARLERGRTQLLSLSLRMDSLAEAATPALREDLATRRAAYARAVADQNEGSGIAAELARRELQELARANNLRSDPTSIDEAASGLAPNEIIIAPLVMPRRTALLSAAWRDGAVLMDGRYSYHYAPERRAENPEAQLWRLLQGPPDARGTGWVGRYQTAFARDATPAQRQAFLDAIDQVGDPLWRIVGAGVAAAAERAGVPRGGRIYWMPSGGLGIMPIGLARDPANGERLIDRYEIVTIPSLAAFVAARARAQTDQHPSLVGLFNPTGDLPAAEIEQELVARYFARRTDIPIGADSAAFFRAAGAGGYWHLATHASFDWIDPARTGLELGGGRRLNVGDLVLGVNHANARLVVLSACETGLFNIRDSSHEFVGLPSAFLQAGAGGVIASLWPVADLSSALFMAKFYDLHIAGNVPIPTALRATQLWMRDASADEIEQFLSAAHRLSQSDIDEILGLAQEQPTAQPFSHPYFWAGYSLFGA